MNDKVIVVVPAFNEEKTIGRVINDLLLCKQAGLISEVVVVANGCTDNTVKEVRKTKAKLIIEKTANKGNALILGAKWMHQHGAGILLMVDADAKKIETKKIKSLIDPVKKGLTPMSVAEYNFSHLAPNSKPSIKYSGFRAISMKALNPVLIGNRNWTKNMTTGPYSVETALNFHIFGKKYLLQTTPLPPSAIVPVNFTLTRKPRSVEEVGRNVYSMTKNFMQRAEKARQHRLNRITKKTKK